MRIIILKAFCEAFRTLSHAGYLTFPFYRAKYAGSDAVDWALTPSAKIIGNTHTYTLSNQYILKCSHYQWPSVANAPIANLSFYDLSEIK